MQCGDDFAIGRLFSDGLFVFEVVTLVEVRTELLIAHLKNGVSVSATIYPATQEVEPTFLTRVTISTVVHSRKSWKPRAACQEMSFLSVYTCRKLKLSHAERSKKNPACAWLSGDFTSILFTCMIEKMVVLKET